MLQSEIDEAIFQKYIAPTKKKRAKCVGIEIEMPIVDLQGTAVKEEICIDIARQFREAFGFLPNGKDDDGNIYSMLHKETGDTLSFDCSYTNLELSLGKGKNLFEIKARFETYYTFLNAAFSEYQYTLTGMGVNPAYNINHNQPIPNERYRMLYHHLHTYKKYQNNPELHFCDRADFGTFTSASQVQIDVDYDDLIDTINTFGKLEPFKAVLFGNSYMQEYPENMMVRNMLWEHSMQGYNAHNIGMFGNEITDIDDLLSYIKTTSIYCTMRNGKYVNFKPIPIEQYLKMEEVKGEYFDGNQYVDISIKPNMEDLDHLRSFKFEDLTFRGTIEFRSTCCQPIYDSMTVAAFHLGLINELQTLKDFLQQDTSLYNHGYSALELQKMMSLHDIPAFVSKEELKNTLIEILDIATIGLKQRGFGEEQLLQPLYDRANRLSNPAKDMVKGLKQGKTINDFILEYSSIEQKKIV